MNIFSDPKKKKIVILIGHPNNDPTTSSEMGMLYEVAAKKAGHEVKKFHLANMHFDPILHKGYLAIQQLEPDLVAFQEAIKWADHFVVIYPNWWLTMPALLKGLFDRMWLPGFAFNMRKNKEGQRVIGWHKRLKGKTARIIVLCGNHPLYTRLWFGDFTNEIKKGIIWFAGFKPKVTLLGPTDFAPEWKRNEWRKKVMKLGKFGE